MLMGNRTRSTDGGSIVFGAIGRVSNFVQTSSVDRRMGNRGWASVTIGAIARQNDTPCFWPQPRMALRLGFFRKLGVVPVRKIRSVCWNDRLVICVLVIGARQSTVKWKLTPASGGPS
jgi:hypothetical protein